MTRDTKKSDPAEPPPLYVDRVAERLLASIDPAAPTDSSTRRMLADALAMAARVERSIALQRARIAWLMDRTVRDDVTDLLNRRGFTDALRVSLARARRFGETGALIYLEIDDFPEIQETYGKPAGDYVLAAVGNILRTRFREIDYTARVDSGRFAVLLTMIDSEDAQRRAAAMVGFVNSLAVPWQGQDIAVRLRVGLAHFDRNDEEASLLERVEADLEASGENVMRFLRSAE
jgi:diguanylate cyclase (GGDEF)-like protein